MKAAADLAAIEGRVVDELATFLARPHQFPPTSGDRCWSRIKVSVPDKNGTPPRRAARRPRRSAPTTSFDWLAQLTAQPAQPALGEVIADIAAIRALAASRRIDAARAILAVAFAPDTMIYFDECGRQLRKMAPYSVPALIIGLQHAREKGKRNKAFERYSNYQLERLDRQEPSKCARRRRGRRGSVIATPRPTARPSNARRSPRCSPASTTTRRGCAPPPARRG